MNSYMVEPNTGNVHQCCPVREKTTASLHIQRCALLGLVLPCRLPAGCSGTEDYCDHDELLPGFSAHTSQSVAGRPSPSRCRSAGMMGVWAGGSLNRRCAGRSSGSQTAAESQTYQSARMTFKMSEKGHSDEHFLPLTTLLSISQRGWPDRIPWCTPVDRSAIPRIRSLHRHKYVRRRLVNAGLRVDVWLQVWAEQRQGMRISNLVLSLIVYQRRCQLLYHDR